MAIELGNSNDTFINNLLYKFPFIVLNIINLKLITNPDDKHIIEINKKLNKNKEIIIYNNKIKLFDSLNNIATCPICYDTKLNICLDCGHILCIDCYQLVKNCYMRCC